MDQQQKNTIIAEYMLSPRCVKSHRAKPNDHFYSWKNFLNPQVSSLSSQIKQAKRTIESGLTEPHNLKTRVDILPQQMDEKNRKAVGDRNSLSNLEIKTTPLKGFHKHSRSTLTQEESDLTKQQTPITIEFQTSTIKNEEKGSRKQRKEGNESRMPVREAATQNKLYWLESKSRKAEQEIGNSEKIQYGDQLDLYHLQLKEEERMYLLRKFIEHYQKTHGLKF